MTDCSFINQLANQRRQFALLSIPPTRFTPVSPYPKYTQFQLDMRRKAEILQHSATKSNTKTNNLTKKQEFAMLVQNRNRKLTQQEVAVAAANSNIVDCVETIYTPTSSSDVPGPVIYLYNDPNIPLYNYNISSSVGIQNNQDTQQWYTNAKENTYFTNGSNTLLSLLAITKYIENSTTTYSFQTSAAIYVNGNITTLPSSSTYDLSDVSISVSKVQCYVYYGEDIVASPTVYHDFTDLSVDINYSKVGSFTASLFVGNITINGIQLYTTPNFVYKIMLKFTLSYSSKNEYFNYNDIGVYCNTTKDTEIASNNCIISGTLSSNTSATFLLNGS